MTEHKCPLCDEYRKWMEIAPEFEDLKAQLLQKTQQLAHKEKVIKVLANNMGDDFTMPRNLITINEIIEWATAKAEEVE